MTARLTPADALRRGITAVRRYGWRGTIERLRQRGVSPDVNAGYPAWCQRHTPDEWSLAAMAVEAERLVSRPLMSIITPAWNTEPRWLRAAVESVRRQVYPNWELCLADDGSRREDTREVFGELARHPQIKIVRLPENRNISAASNAALASASGEFVVLLDHDDELTPDALYEIARYLNEHPDVDAIYSDEDKLDAEGRRCDPYFKPDWSPDHFLSNMYTCHVFAVRRKLVADIGGFRVGYEGAQDYDLMLRIMEKTSRIGHIPKILYHWRKVEGSAASELEAKPWAHVAAQRALTDHLQRTDQSADVVPGDFPGVFRIKYHVQRSPLVSIIIPTRASSTVRTPLERCLESLAKTRYARYEIIVVGDSAEAPSWINGLAVADRIRWQRYQQPGAFNFSDKINCGAAASRGEHLLLLNDDTEVIEADWLEAMLEHSQRREIGAVGTKLLYPDGRLQHIGLILGVCGVAAHAFHQHPRSCPGYASSAVGVRNYSAVTGACLMTRRTVFEEVGGLDPRFPLDFNDVDYCLRVRRAGYRIVFTPYARLIHNETSTAGWRGSDPGSERLMRERWSEDLVRDPYYNLNLARNYSDYRLGD